MHENVLHGELHNGLFMVACKHQSMEATAQYRRSRVLSLSRLYVSHHATDHESVLNSCRVRGDDRDHKWSRDSPRGPLSSPFFFTPIGLIFQLIYHCGNYISLIIGE